MAPEIRKVDWNEFHDIVTCLSLEIEAGYVEYDYLYGVPRGGMIPTIMLSHMLRIPVITHIEYDILAENRILVVDDIIDPGKTINKFKKVFDTASVFVKESVKFRPTYWVHSGLVQDNQWIMFPYEIETNDPISQVNMDHNYANCPCSECKSKREGELLERLQI